MSEQVTTPDLGGMVRRGLAWSAVSSLVLRFGTVAVGIALARLLTPEEFGVYAVALTVQAILMTFADLGLSAGLIVTDDPEAQAPTVGALGLAAGLLTGGLMALCADPIASAMGSPASSPAIEVLALALVLAGAGVVPYAMLQRQFAQKALFGISVVDFCISTVVTLALVVAGWGVVSIAIGRVCAQAVACILQFRLARVRPRFAFDPAVARPVLAFGLPVAGTTLLSWVVLNMDNVVVVKVAGTTELGFYVLAFNIAMWPMSALGQVVRSVSLPAFSRQRETGDRGGVLRAFGLTGLLALPAGVCLAVLATPVVLTVYGSTWRPSAQVLAVLGLFGGFRVMFDLMAALLLARGRSGRVLWIQVCWCVALFPALLVGTRAAGAAGAGWAHLVVGLTVVVPAYAVALRGEGLRPDEVWRAVRPAALACVPAAAAAALVVFLVEGHVAELVGGLAVGGLVYLALVHRPLLRMIRGTDGEPRRDPVLAGDQASEVI